MFNFSGASSLLAGQHDSRKERAPPSRPIPVTFPSLVPPEPSTSTPPPAWDDGPSPGISAKLLNLRKPSDIDLDTLALLNVSFQPQCDFETLLSTASNTTKSYLPPKSWLDLPEHKEPPSSNTGVQLLSSGRRVPDRNEFYVRAKELFFKNEDAFNNLTRKANCDRVPLRLAHFRKFWEGLDSLAYYWDNSLDEYFPPKPETVVDGSNDTAHPGSQLDNDSHNDQPTAEPETENNADTQQMPHMGSSQHEEPRKKAKLETSGNETITQVMPPTKPNSAVTPAKKLSITSSRALPARTAPPKLPWNTNVESQASSPAEIGKGSYRGYRIGNGAEMPDQYRLDCVRSFLEPITWAFGVTLVPHRRPPVLVVEHVRFPVRMSCVAWRGPQDRVRARQGWMEGPVLGIQCRQDTNFGATGNLQAESVLDAVRELGGMLLLAQERAREGQVEKRGGEGMWWTSKHRWGGGLGGEVGEATGASDDGCVPKVEEKPPIRTRLGSKERRRPTQAEIWKVIRPGNPLWDPKVVYEAIGKDHDVEWDNIFMVSSLNHHISVLKLRVHPLYVKYITDGTLPEDSPSCPNWCSPQLQRTRWFDLFDVEDRKEAMRGIWGIMAYLLRGQEKPDVAMKDA